MKVPALLVLSACLAMGSGYDTHTHGTEDVSHVLAGDYYVATNGDDSAAGTIVAPFKTIQHAADVMVAGDTCHIRGGNYHEAVVIDGLNGSSGSPITFTGYNNEVVTMDGSQPLTDLGSTGWTLHSGNIYKTTLNTDIWQLYVDGELMIPARWPNGNFDDGSIWDWENIWARGMDGQANGTLVDDPDAADLASSGLGNMTGVMAILNVGSFKTWTRIVDITAGSGTFSYALIDPALSYRDKHQHYFLEGKLELLDAGKEWFYDTGSKVLYLQVPGGGAPTGNIRGKTQAYAFDVGNSTHITLKGLNFFGTTFKFENIGTEGNHVPGYITVEDCDLLYPSCSRRMLGTIPETDGNFKVEAARIAQVNAGGNEKAQWPSESRVKNCSFAFAESHAISMIGGGSRIENCDFKNIDWVVSDLPYLMATIYLRGEDCVFVRNTVQTSGASELLDFKHAPVVEYNEFMDYGLVQNDGSAVQLTVGAQPGSITRYNWFHDTVKYGARFDSSTANGSGGWMHHNVGWKTESVLMIKGVGHKCYNNTAFDTSLKNDIIVLDGEAGSNVGTITRNNVANKIAGDRKLDDPVPGDYDPNYNWNGYETGQDIRTQLRDPDNLDFRPIAGSPLVDGGEVVAGITDGYLGSAPDIGAYESGASNYWIPGRKLAHASSPVPPDNATGVKRNADLMWREGYQATSHDVYFGTAPGSLVFQGNLANNIFDPGTLAANTVYYWRVDAVTPSGTVTGPVATFETSALPSEGDDGGGGGGCGAMGLDFLLLLGLFRFALRGARRG